MPPRVHEGRGPRPRWFVRGDIDGFFGLALDNLIQVLVIIGLSSQVLGFSQELVLGRMLPGVSVSLIAGNLFYAWQAHRLAARTGRGDVCALPYGINTVSLFGFLFLVMLPVKIAAEKSGHSSDAASELAFRAGLVAAVGSGLIEAGGAFVVAFLRRWTPRAALLSSLAGVAVTFIALDFLFRTFAHPLVAFVPLGVVLLTYFGRVRFPGGLPGGLVALTLGTSLAWASPFLDWNPEAFQGALRVVGFHAPEPTLTMLWAGLAEGHFGAYFAVILPMGLFNLVGSLQNLDSAAAAGDDFPTGPSLVANGLGTLLGAAFGSPFPTTIYIGHPGWKTLGARIGYSVLNGIFFTLLGLSGAAALVGYLVPIEAGMAIVLWIGIIMAAQAFQAVPRTHAPAVAAGLLPGIAAWGAYMVKRGLLSQGPQGASFGPHLLPWLERAGLSAAHGAFALEQGFMLSAMLWAALTVEVIERRFLRAAAWALSGALLSGVGLIHSYAWLGTDTVQRLALDPTGGFTLGYLLLATVLAVGRLLPEDASSRH